MEDIRPMEAKTGNNGNNKQRPDLLNREKFANLLINYIHNKKSAVLALKAPWGTGKTFLVKEILFNKLEKGKIPYLYLDAFKCDYISDPFAAIIDKLVIEFHKKQEELGLKKTKIEDLWNKANKAKRILSRRFAENIPDIVAELASRICLATLAKTVVESAKDLTKEESTTNNLKSWQDEKDKDNKIVKELRELLEQLTEESHNKKLVFFIDELDRCRPDFCVELLEKIKHIFSVKNIVFVLVVNPQQLENSIKHIYGYDIDAIEYLYKFFDLQFTLPHLSSHPNYDARSFVENQLYEIIYHAEENKANKLKRNKEFFVNIINESNASLRDIQKAFELFDVVTVINPKLEYLNFIFFLILAKVTQDKFLGNNNQVLGKTFECIYKNGTFVGGFSPIFEKSGMAFILRKDFTEKK
ncbi:P-loop NTPase fold protein [Lentisphaerota bacterium ZTH]|nr:hypothetical protein JYG24_10485 [Lentisphaerota bacterium]WET06081.1 P-loop NTPase fold protein [Lentisphaerota bacterium ZTH]